ncbi:unnamed protein product [Cylicocyclus nassatus]|uniref:Uncharacterized protein n=1 Tax=Cylicocyclus nassatus TaxID=53992 RepID=A0AA36DJ69_CYLNA|nr:unnamed protein product [Cylicocyclus nassatus]
MCVRRKTAVSTDTKKNVKKESMDSPKKVVPLSPTANMPSGGTQEFLKKKQKDKEKETETEEKTSSSKRQVGGELVYSHSKHGASVSDPSKRKAKRPMIEVRSARDPEYKTIQLDASEWESVKLYKRSEINLEEFLKQENNVLQRTQ